MSALLAIAALAIAVTLAAVLGLLPVVRLNAPAAYNNMWRVTMPPRLSDFVGSNSWHGIYAQEVVEWVLRWWLALLLAAPAAWFVPERYALAFIAALPLAYVAANRLPFCRRQVELIGHTCEVVIAEEREGRSGYLTAKAQAIHRWQETYYGNVFSGWSVARISAALDARRGAARILIALLRRAIRKGKNR